MLDFIRIAAVVPRVQVGDIDTNVAEICRYIGEADEKQVDVVTFPELSVTGYTCADLFFQQELLCAEKTGLRQILECSAEHPAVTAVVGITATIVSQLYNCAAVISGGEIRGLVPKTYISTDEARWFASAAELPTDALFGRQLGMKEDYLIPVGRDLLFELGDGAKLGVEIGADLFAPVSQSNILALQGAEVIVNLAASVETVGRRNGRRGLICQTSAMNACVYSYTSAGYTESTQDVVFGGHSLIACGGQLLAENKNLIDTDYMIVADADLGLIRASRGNKLVRDCASLYAFEPRIADCGLEELRSDGSLLHINKLPLIPETAAARNAYCMDVFQIQVAGLKRRLMAIGAKAVIGVSGGLDSTLALLVCAEAMRQLGRPASDVFGITMPCYGTSDRTYNNSLELMEKLGITSKEVNIRDAVTLHFRDIGHDIENRNATYENAQARERTQILMDYAGDVGGIVIGTGDLSELALGWCTFNGDHMSMYAVNGSVPKTLIRWMIAAIAEHPDFIQAKDVLLDILDTPISPELLPPDAQGKIAQQTEDIVGPYALHDFYLYYLLRYGYGPKKIYTLACRAFANDFDAATIKKWLTAFYRRFFTQQFKRNCQPDGIKALPVSLGPRSDWKMPSDASYKLWMKEIEKL